MSFEVFLVQDAEEDILAIYRYVKRRDSKQSATRVYEKLRRLCLGLEEFPERGHVPFELAGINVSSYLEIHEKPYRVIYELDREKVFVHAVLDGRRDLQELLERRLLR